MSEVKIFSTILHFLGNAWRNGFLTCLKKYAVFKGRATRFEYWSFSIILALILSSVGLSLAIIGVDKHISDMDYAFRFLLDFVEFNIIAIDWLKIIFHFDVNTFYGLITPDFVNILSFLFWIGFLLPSISVNFHFYVNTLYWTYILENEANILSFLFWIVFLLPCISVNVRRLRDIGRSEWWLIPLLMPGILDLVFTITSPYTYTTPLILAIYGVIANVSMLILAIIPTSKKNLVEQKLPKIVIVVMVAIIYGLSLYGAVNNYTLIYSDVNYDRAIAAYTEVLKKKPDDYEILNKRGIAYHNDVDYDRAIEDYSATLRIKPGYHEALSNRGLAHMAKDNYDRAIEDYTEVLRIKPDDYEALNNRGYAYFRKGNYDRAIEDYSAALRIKPNYHEALRNRGSAYFRKGNYDQYKEDLNEANKIKPDYYYEQCGGGRVSLLRIKPVFIYDPLLCF